MPYSPEFGPRQIWETGKTPLTESFLTKKNGHDNILWFREVIEKVAPVEKRLIQHIGKPAVESASLLAGVIFKFQSLIPPSLDTDLLIDTLKTVILIGFEMSEAYGRENAVEIQHLVAEKLIQTDILRNKGKADKDPNFSNLLKQGITACLIAGAVYAEMHTTPQAKPLMLTRKKPVTEIPKPFDEFIKNLKDLESL